MFLLLYTSTKISEFPLTVSPWILCELNRNDKEWAGRRVKPLSAVYFISKITTERDTDL